MTEAVFLILGLIVGFAVAWVAASGRGRRGAARQIQSLVESLRSGNTPDPHRMGGDVLPPLKELRTLLAQDWVPRDRAKGEEARTAMLQIASYLRHRVEAPLLEGLDGSDSDLRAGADEALGAVEDLEFFLEDPAPSNDPKAVLLADLVQEVTREFTSQSTTLVEVVAPHQAVRVRVEPEPVKDAIFLILHNAEEFSGERPVHLTVGVSDGQGTLTIRDEGPGFTAEGLIRAMDPFYSTSPGGLGLGLPHARRAVNAQGGEMFLRNGDEGGAVVEVRLPLAG